MEMESLLRALDGEYVLPGPGGDPIRNPGVLPSGKNIHALDPQAIPTRAAVAAAKGVVDKLIERQREEQGTWPETIACVLWGTDNIKTYGESLAQILWFVGVKPMAENEGGRSRHKCVVTTPIEDGFFKITTSDGMSWKKDKEKRAGRLPTAVLHPFQERP